MPDYAAYVAAGGLLSEEEYAAVAANGWAYLDALTMGKAASAVGTTGGKVMSAFVAVVQEMHQQAQGGEVVSASNDGYSETYAASGKTGYEKLATLATMHLATTGLLFRGMDYRACL